MHEKKQGNSKSSLHLKLPCRSQALVAASSTDVQDLLELRQHPVKVRPLPEHLSTAGADEVHWNPGRRPGARSPADFGPAGEFEGLGVQGGTWGPAAVRGELGALWGPPAIVFSLCFSCGSQSSRLDTMS